VAGERKSPGPVAQSFGRLSSKVAVHAPRGWPLLRGVTRRFFDGRAPGWDEYTRAESPERLAPIGAALEHVDGEPARALDIGTGTGTGAFYLASRYPRAEVVGIDIAPAMVERAHEKAALRTEATGAALAGRVRFEVADISTFGPEVPFDLVLMLNMPPFFDRVAALLAPGGHVVSIASRGPTTPYYTPPGTLSRRFGRLGIETVFTGSHGGATYFVARRAT
jgi:SAM-dependent methyltransferase